MNENKIRISHSTGIRKIVTRQQIRTEIEKLIEVYQIKVDKDFYIKSDDVRKIIERTIQVTRFGE